MSAPDANGWMPIETHPRDGRRFLAWTVSFVDEYDEDVLVRRGVREEAAVVAYELFGQIISFPFSGGIPTNVHFTHWQDLPSGPVSP